MNISLIYRLLILPVMVMLSYTINAQFDRIHIDQFGYYNHADKVAVISNPIVGYNSNLSFTPSAIIELRRSSDDAVVFCDAPKLWNIGNTHSQSGDQGWWFDFSIFTASGIYHVYDPASGQRSGDFTISCDPYAEVLQAAFKSFYYNRSNHTKAVPYAEPAWTDGINFTHAGQDANCRFVFDQSDASLERDLRGGWFDAGDYNKYVTYAYHAVQKLLYAYEENPALFSDNMNIPESGNGVSDLLDEIKWELDWLRKMINSDGSVIQKMGSISHSDNNIGPPSMNFDSRYYGNTCTSASIATAGMFAHAAKVYRAIPGMSTYASLLQTEAITCYNYFISHFDAGTLETNCDDTTIKSGDADWPIDKQLDAAIVTSVYLYDLTGDNNYRIFVEDNYMNTEPIAQNVWGPYRTEVEEALLIFANLPGVASSVSSDILTKATAPVNGNWNNEFTFSDEDLYRAYSPDWNYHWGSNESRANNGNLCFIMRKYDIAPAQHNSLDYKTTELIHYYHGVNPLGIVYLSNMYDYGAEHSVNEIFHTWFSDGSPWDNALTSQYGPAPGFMAGGPNQNYPVSSVSPPHNQPQQKSYKDFNDDWPNNSWEITEPSIYNQAAYIRFLSNVMGSQAQLCSSCVNSGNICDDNDPCTINDVYDATCNCVGANKLIDSDNDGVCDGQDQCPGYDDNLDTNNNGQPDDCESCATAGTLCDDGDPNTMNDIEDGFCNCAGVCKPANTPCDDGDPNTANDYEDGNCNCISGCLIAGLPCEDGNPFTGNDMTDGNCNCIGGCATYGTVCNDGNPATTNDIYDGNCNCAGSCLPAGSPCDDGDPNTSNDVYNGNCVCQGDCPLQNTPCDDSNSLTLNDVHDGFCNCYGIQLDYISCYPNNHFVIDGSNQEWDQNTFNMTKDVFQNITSITDLSGTFMVAHADNSLYVFAKINDSNLINDSANAWDDDSFEIYIDGGDEDALYYDINDHQFVFRYNDNNVYLPSQGAINPAGVIFQQSTHVDGFQIEVKIPYSLIGLNRLVGDQSGFDVHYNDDDDGSGRDKKLAWFDENDKAWETPRVFGTMELDDCSSTCSSVGQPCNDNNPCSSNDVYDINCNCAGTTLDSDNDGVCDALDSCHGFDDNQDIDGDGTPDGCQQFSIGLKVMLCGYMDNNSIMSNQLMVSGILPSAQPFNTAPWFYTGAENVSSFSSDIIDWVLVMVRESSGAVISQRALLLKSDGTLVDDSGQTVILFPGAATTASYHVSIHPRNHLAVVSSTSMSNNTSFDFTIGVTQAKGILQQNVIGGAVCLYAGDFDANGIINNLDFNLWKLNAATNNQYLPIDGDGSTVVNNLDYNLWYANRSKIGEPEIRY